MSVSPPWAPTSPGIRVAEAVIVDDTGAVVARRTVSDRATTSCVPLARAVGAWAALVVDAELGRAKDTDAEPRPRGAGFVPVQAFTPVAAGPIEASPPDPGVPPDADGPTLGGDDTPPNLRRPIPVELGSMVYLRNGMSATGGVAGVAPFVAVEVSTGWVLRPSAYFGRSTGRVPVSATEASHLSHVGLRTDFCRRIPGNYIERRGVVLDLCAGVDAALVTSDSAGGEAGRLGVGPAANLRGELGGGLALEVRALFGANLLRAPIQTEQDAALVFAAAELGLSVRLR
jgi:hypothetical protein